MILKNKVRFKTFFFLILLCLITSATKANKSKHSHLFTKSQAKTTKINYEYFNAQKTKKTFKYSIDLGNFGIYELVLKPNNLFDADFKKELQGKNSLPLTFSGKVTNQVESQVILTINQNFMSGYVYNGETTIFFEPLYNFNKQAKANELIIYDEKDVLNKKFYCTHEHLPISFKVEQQKQQFAKRAVCDEYNVEMVLVADYSMFQKYESATAVRNQITSIINAAQTNFDDEFNDPIIFKIVDEYISTKANDDLWDTSEKNAEKLLKQFAESNFTDKVFDLASLWVTREIFEIKNDEKRNLAGLAYNGRLCNDAFKFNLLRDYDVSFASLRTTCAHEIGHNFSAVHDPDNTEFIMTQGAPSNTWSTTSLNSINSFYPNTNCLCSTNFVDFDAKSFCGSFGTGDNITVSPTIENIGSVVSEPTELGIFLSEDLNITIDDYLLSKVSFDALQPGESRNVSVSINFKNADLPCGDYYYGVIVDAENNIAEPKESNNIACTGIHTIVDCELSDLIIENCSSVFVTGTKINTGNITLTNIGDKTAPSSLVGYYLSSDKIIEATDYLIAQSNFPPILPGASFNRLITRDISEVTPPIPPGNYYIGVLADRKNTLQEVNENNNSCYADSPTFTIIGNNNGSDLVVENCNSISISGTTINTGKFSVSNIGNEKSDEALLGVYLSIDPTIDDNDYLIAQSNFAAMESGESISRVLARDITAVKPPIPAGIYYVGFLADRKNILQESNENNNSCYANSLTFTIGDNNGDPSKADLVIENCDKVKIIGNTINTGKFTVKNIGRVSSVSTLLGVYLSIDPTIDDSDYLNAQSNFAAIKPGASISRVLARNIEDVNHIVPSGTYYIGFLADRKNTLQEANEANNSCYDSVFQFTKSDNKLTSTKISNSYNYPNPFTDITSINYTLTKDAKVSINIYEATGKQVVSLLNNKTQKAGEHIVEFNGSYIPAGLYYYHIKSNDFITLQKMILMK